MPTAGEANSVSRGLDRDRIVDETGGQTVVFGRRGSRPFHLAEMAPFFRRLGSGDLYKVEDVTLADGKLTTRGGTVLAPLATPTPVPTEAPIEPTPCLFCYPSSNPLRRARELSVSLESTTPWTRKTASLRRVSRR